MTPQELMEWESWYMIEMPDRTDFYMQQLLALTKRAHFKGQAKPSDFAPDLRTPEQCQKQALRAIEAEAQVEKMRKRGSEVLERQRGQVG